MPTYTYTYIGTYLHIHIHIHVQRNIHIFVCIHIHIHVYIHMMYFRCTHMCKHMYIMCICIHTFVYSRMYIVYVHIIHKHVDGFPNCRGILVVLGLWFLYVLEEPALRRCDKQKLRPIPMSGAHRHTPWLERGRKAESCVPMQLPVLRQVGYLGGQVVV